MAISDVQEYMHLTDEEIEQLGRELDAIRQEVEESRGAADAAYINRMIRIQRGLAVAGRVTLLLGKLASMDPGGRSGNRPIASLRDIFVAWKPGTNAPLAERLAAVDDIIAAYPVTGWQLVVALLPKLHDSKGPTQRPLFREAGASEREQLTYADLEMDTVGHKVRRAGEVIPLGPTEFRLLKHFLEHPGWVFSRERLLDAVWGHDSDIEARTVDVHIRRLRKAINRNDQQDIIRTVRSAGYALDSGA